MIAPGIYRDFSIEDYYRDPAPEPSLSQSIAKVLLDQSPAHAAMEHPRLKPHAQDDDEIEKYSAVQAIGSAAHRLLIGRGKEIAIGSFDAWRTKEAKQFREDAETGGRIPILSKHFDRASEMVEAAREQLDDIGWHDAFRVGHGEVCLIWQEGPTWFRTLVDWEASLTEYDYKSGGVSFAPHDIGFKMERDGWHIQGAMHERGYDALDPQNAGRRKFRFVAQENYPPYALVGVELTENWLTMGRKALEMVIPVWRQCLANKRWPAYPPTVIRPEFPGFKESRFLQREMEAAEMGDRQTILDAG